MKLARLFLPALVIAIILTMGCTVGFKKEDQGNNLVIHYHRFDSNYTDWKLWTWLDQTQVEVLQYGKDDFGAIFMLDINQYPSSGDINLLPKFREWERKDSPERSWYRAMPGEIWLVENDPKVYTQRPNTNPIVRKGFLDAPEKLTLLLSNPVLQTELKSITGAIKATGKGTVPITQLALYPDTAASSNILIAIPAQPLGLADLPAKVNLSGFEAGDIFIRYILDDPAFITNEPLGVFREEKTTSFAVWAPGATSVILHLYDQPQGGKPENIKLQKSEHGTWKTSVNQDLLNRYYTYSVDGPDPSYSPDKELIDPYARCVTAHNGRGMIVHDETPVSPSPRFSLSEAMIYEIHIRDFTIGENSGVKHKGKYLGFSENGTLLPGSDIKTGLDHLAELGINAVQLMPLEDFEHNDAANNYFWGYMTVNFNSPDGWFAENPDDASRIAEFKQLVDALHKQGIKVIMDVVYNHTAEGSPSVVYNFNGFVPNYYYRQRIDGTYWNGSGCGNEVRSEHPIVRRFIVESLKYWVTEYGIDGFRFDLMGLHDMETMEEIVETLQTVKPDIILYGEPWAAGDTPITPTVKGTQRGKGFSVFNDNFRDALKGPWYNTEPGYIQTGLNAEAVKKGIAGSIDDFTDAPTEALNYVACHDGRTLWDQLVASTEKMGAMTDTQLKSMDKLAAVILYTSQGIPFIHGGQEFLRTKFGSHNSYNQPDKINKIRWDYKQENLDVFKYYQGLISLRKNHPMFRMKTAGEVRKYLSFLPDVPENCIAYRIEAGQSGDSWSEALILINPNKKPVSFKISDEKWIRVVDEIQAGDEIISPVSGPEITLKPISAAVLYCL